MTLRESTLKNTKSVRGFTLIEMMVSLAVFSVVVVLSMSAIVSVLDSNQKSQTLRSAMDNLNVTLESMTRAIRFGTTYHCGLTGSGTADCGGGDTGMMFIGSDGVRVRYNLSEGRIVRSSDIGAYTPMTSADIIIEKLTFYVSGSTPYPGDNLQPRVVIVIKGYTGAKASTKTSFVLSTTISQRQLDYQ
ncbi:MAG: prepilin-type N-terminal cleavage/methylation domain-containing protein [Patescibacteria group bacterium]